MVARPDGTCHDYVKPRQSDTDRTGGEAGTRVAYVATIAKKQLAVVDGTESDQYDSILGLKFSPDGKRLAYVATLGRKKIAVTD